MVVEQHVFREGDLVRLKAGGPVMAVKFEVDELLLCAWIDAAGRTRRQTYSPDQVDLVHSDSMIWLKVFLRLSTRWPVVAAC